MKTIKHLRRQWASIIRKPHRKSKQTFIAQPSDRELVVALKKSGVLLKWRNWDNHEKWRNWDNHPSYDSEAAGWSWYLTHGTVPLSLGTISAGSLWPWWHLGAWLNAGKQTYSLLWSPLKSCKVVIRTLICTSDAVTACVSAKKNLNNFFYFLVRQPGQCCLFNLAFPLLPYHVQPFPQAWKLCMLWTAKQCGEGLRLGESDCCRILPSLFCCCDTQQASYVWATSCTASFLKTPQSSWSHDFITVLKPSQFMGILMPLALVQSFFSSTFISHFTWLFAFFFFLNEQALFLIIQCYFFIFFFAMHPSNPTPHAPLWNKGKEMLYISQRVGKLSAACLGTW